MLRIHLMPADRGRVTLAGPDVMTELFASAQMLSLGRLGRRYPGLGRDVPPAARPLFQLVERPEGCPDFLRPGVGGGYRPALDALLATPTPRLQRELTGYRELAWTRDPVRIRRTLATAVDSYDRHAFRPLWRDSVTVAASDQALRAHTLTAHGLSGLLNDIYPTISWRSPTLVITCEDDRGVDQDLHLGGRVCASCPSRRSIGPICSIARRRRSRSPIPPGR